MPQPSASPSSGPQLARDAAVIGTAAAATDLAGAAAGAGAGVAGGAGKLAPATVKATVAGIVAGLIAFLARVREANRAWLGRELGRHSKDASDIQAVIDQEMQLEQVFAARAAERVAKALPLALRITDPEQRRQAVRQILADEERFARQRSEAMAARAIAALSRYALRRESPLGAFWQLGHAAKHTEGCLHMGDKFWPWVVLDRVHPPRHYGCVSSLHGFGEAVAAGWMRAGDVPDTAAAIKAAVGVVMEAEEADGLLREVELRDRLIESGVQPSVLAEIPFAGVLAGVKREEAKGGG